MTTAKALSARDYKEYFEKAILYKDYKTNFEKEILLGEESPYAQYLPQNWSRQSRLDRKLKITQHLQHTVDSMQQPIKWLVITEHWCGDASQIVPVIAKVAAESKGRIEVRFIYRDEHEALIDAHLTNGRSRSIPILIQLDGEYNMRGTYGPRPNEAQDLVHTLIAKEEPYILPLHTWYAKDKQLAIQQDLTLLLAKIKHKS